MLEYEEVYMRGLIAQAIILLVAASAWGHTVTESWEGNHTVLAMYGSGDPPIIAEAIVGGPGGPIDGAQVLQLVDNTQIGANMVYVAWVVGLRNGDSVDASIWRYDTSPGTSPSCRLWAHWNDDLWDQYGYAGTAGGNYDYGAGEGWDQVCWTWTVEDDHSGLMIEVRVFRYPGDTVWVDYLSVTAPDHAWIRMPEHETPVEPTSWSAVKGLYR
jgi:hypothetical protein